MSWTRNVNEVLQALSDDNMQTGTDGIMCCEGLYHPLLNPTPFPLSDHCFFYGFSYHALEFQLIPMDILYP